MNPIEQARQYLADEGKTLWSDADIRPMVEGLLEELDYWKRKSKRLDDTCNDLFVRMQDIREEGPSLLQRVKNWWRNI